MDDVSAIILALEKINQNVVETKDHALSLTEIAAEAFSRMADADDEDNIGPPKDGDPLLERIVEVLMGNNAKLSNISTAIDKLGFGLTQSTQKFEQAILVQQKTLDMLPTIINQPTVADSQEGTFKEVTAIEIVDFSRVALHKLREMLVVQNQGNNLRPSKVSRSPDAGISDKTSGWLSLAKGLGIFGAIGGLFVLIKAWKDDDRLRQMWKSIGSMALKAPKWLADVFHMAISGISKLGEFAKGAFRILSGADSWLSKLGSTILKPIAKVFGESGILKGIFKLSGLGLFKGLLKGGAKGASKLFWPIGPLIGVGFGVKRVIDGDVAGGILEIAGGLIGLIPGWGTAISIGVDAFLLIRDLKLGGSKQIAKDQSGGNKFINKFLDELKKLTLVKGLMKIGEGFKEMFNGNVADGLGTVLYGLAQFGLGIVVQPYETLMAFLNAGGVEFVKSGWNTVVDWSTKFQKWIVGTALGKWAVRGKNAIAKILNGDVVQGFVELSLLISEPLAATFTFIQDVASSFMRNANADISTASSSNTLWMQLVEEITKSKFGQWVVGLSEKWDQGILPFTRQLFTDLGFGRVFEIFDTTKRVVSTVRNVDYWKVIKQKLWENIPGPLKTFLEFDGDQFSLASAERVLENLGIPTMNQIVAGGKAKISGWWDSISDALSFNAPSTTTSVKKANDAFIPKDGAPILFDNQDSILAAKKDGPIDKILATLTDKSTTQQPAPQPPPQADNMIIDAINGLGDMFASFLQSQSQLLASMQSSPVAGGGPGPQMVYGDGPTRDPAYEFRAKTYGRLTPGVRIS